MPGRPHPSTQLPHSRAVVRRILALAAVILAVVTVGSLVLLSYTARAVDKVQVAEERALVVRKIDRSLGQLVRDVTSAAVWDIAYESLGPTIDLEWSDSELGGYYSSYLGHSLTVVVDERGSPVYAWRGGGRVEPRLAEAFARDAAPLIRQVREREASVLAKAPRPRGFKALVTGRGVVRSEGRLYLVGVTNVVPETSASPWRAGATRLIVSARRLDAAFVETLEEDLRLSGGRIVAGTSGGPAAVTLIDVNGRVVGELAWTPKRPGVGVIRGAAPLFGLGIVILLTAGLALALRIRAVLRELAVNDKALDFTMDALVRARDQADAANIAKSQFLANMSHEIRTPLNGVLGMAQVMARDELSPAQRERLDVVRQAGHALLTILNDILDFSKIEAGRLEIDAHEFDMDEMAHASCDAFAGLADEKGIGFSLVVDEAARGLWWGDGVRIRQILCNLVSNAVKFTSQGEVSVRLERSAEGLRLTVSDTGIGIPAERQADLFQKFSQVDASTTRQYGGTGLGLAISRDLVDLMGGRLSLTSKPGEGATFVADLPLQWRGPRGDTPAAKADPALLLDEAAERVVRILAAEDNPTNQLILKSLLEPFGVELDLVGDGRGAVEAYRRRRYDLVLMDVQMPDMNGIEATLEIRRLESEAGDAATPILALSANVMSHQIAEYHAAGMTGFVPKPIEAAKLFAAIEAALAPGDAVRTAAA